MAAPHSLFGTHAAALELSARRLDVPASNVANAATPGYKARDIDFRSALSEAADAAPLAVTNAQHFAQPGGGTSPRLLYRVPVQVSLDGNTVELSTEQTLFAENAVRYEAALSFVNGSAAQMLAALKID